MKEITLFPDDNISDAVRKAGAYTRVILSEGIYRQKTEISVPYIELVGADADKTVIVNDDYAKKYTKTEKNTTPSVHTLLPFFHLTYACGVLRLKTIP